MINARPWVSPAGNVFWIVEYRGNEIVFNTGEEAVAFIEELEETA